MQTDAGQTTDPNSPEPIKCAQRVIVVSGSRMPLSDDEKRVVKTLIVEQTSTCSSALIVHGAALGVDEFAARVAFAHSVPAVAMQAQWHAHGKSAGPRRNAEMVRLASALHECGWDVVFLAFPRPNSVGTRDLVSKANRFRQGVLGRARVHVVELLGN